MSNKIVLKLKGLVITHKIISALIAVSVLLVGYWIFGKLTSTAGETRYVLGTVQKGAVISSITGSGQVSASNQVELKTKTSGDIVYFNAKAGQEYKAGALLIQIDTRNAEKAVRNAEISFEQAKLDLEKMKGLTTDAGSIRGVKEKAGESIKKAYEDGFNTVANAFLEFPAVISGLEDIMYSKNSNLGGVSTWNMDYYATAAAKYDENTVNANKAEQYKNDITDKYAIARKSYDQNFSDYKAASRFSEKDTIENLINETYETTRNMAEAVKSEINLIQYYKDKLVSHNLSAPAITDTHLSSLSSYTSKTNSYLTSLLSIKTTILTSKETLVATDFDIADQQIKVDQAENSLIDAKDALNDCYVYTPFSGTLAKLNVKRGDTLSSGTSIGTFITNLKISEISLNEIDVAKIKVGQKVSLTFDAVEGLSISGEVAEIDSIGTVSQGVVTYNIKIGFDTEDIRVKPGMSVSAAIITEIKQDVLTVPNSAVKSQGNTYYINRFDKIIPDGQGNQGVTSSVPPVEQTVETGLSNDASTEIISGLKEGDQIIIRTILPSAGQTATQQAPSIFGATGGNRNAGGGGGAIRVAR